MRDQLKKFSQKTLWDINSATSSPELASGATPSVPQNGQMTDRFGPVLAHVSPSPQQGRKAVSTTNGTSGPSSSGLSVSANLSQSLANRLRLKTDLLGSTLFRLIWKERTTPSGRLIPALRASVLRTSGKDSTGWPTPNTPSGGPNVKSTAKHTGGMDLDGAALLTGWPTTRQADGEKNVRSLEGSLREIERKGSPQDLCQASQIAGWGTPVANDDNKSVEAHLAMKKRMGERDGTGANRTAITSLAVQAKAAFWSTPRANKWGFPDAHGSQEKPMGIGKKQIGFPVSIEKSGQLNPAHSRWLMGLKIAWDSCGAMVTLSSRRKLKHS